MRCSNGHGRAILHQGDLRVVEIGCGLLLQWLELPCCLQLLDLFYWFWVPSEYTCACACVRACACAVIQIPERLRLSAASIRVLALGH